MKRILFPVPFGILFISSLLLARCSLSQPLFETSIPGPLIYTNASIQLTSEQNTIVGPVSTIPKNNLPSSTPSNEKSNSNLSSSPTEELTATIDVLSTTTPDPKQIPTNLDPEEFIKYYYSNINKRNYELTWSLLTQAFISRMNPPSSGGYQGYIDWWNTVDHVDLSQVDILSRDKDSATVSVSSTYYYRNGAITKSLVRFYLIFDSKRGTWFID